MADGFDIQFSFFSALRYYYESNRGKIRRNYKDLTRKFLDYNDKITNPNAYLRRPQFEALEMYVFIKEFMNNKQVFTMFDEWRNKQEEFSDASYYTVDSGQVTIYDLRAEQSKVLFNRMRKYSENYPNYIYALTMGLGKTILMATCIFYEFLLSNKYPKDKTFCHNALVFAPDKTVLQSLREIFTFDKSLVVPPEYARVLDSNIKIHYLKETGTTLNTLDDSDFNIIISNTQKIILKKRHKEKKAGEMLFNMSSTVTDSVVINTLKDIYGDDNIQDNKDLIFNQRFEKLIRLSQLGVYVDEAHHMFGTDLEKALRSNATKTSLRNTINELAINLKRKGTGVVACYNYTGTPYIKNTILPEVVYAYGLKDSIINNYLKEADIKGYENVKNKEFLKSVITDFWNTYGENKYEGLLPKLAIFGSRIEEITDEIKPMVEDILSDLGLHHSKILVNVGDSTVTKNEDIRNFNNLDAIGTEGSLKQFILLVDKGREGWNCRSLFGVALFRSPKSKIFVLQATMRCLRKITDIQQEAKVYLSKENFDILDAELKQNFRMSIEDLKKPSKTNKYKYEVRPVPPPKYVKLKYIKHNYSLHNKEYSEVINFGLSGLNYSKYISVLYEKQGLTNDMVVKKKNIDKVNESIKYSLLMIVGEIARYLNIKGSLIFKIITESEEGVELILEKVNKYNDIIYDEIIPKIFKALFDVKCDIQSIEKDVLLLKYPKDSGFYEFSADQDLVVKNVDLNVQKYKHKSFHADIYCFDSKPEKECFWQYIVNDKVKEIYFTGMFTSNQSEFFIQYFDPESNRLRRYYPDFFAKMADGTYQIIEVKGDNKIEDAIVVAKADATKEIAMESSIEYIIYKGSTVMSTNLLDN
ncbi:DEAD/DEAH box helicase family protein [Clostridium algoriphilum]|uniref:TnsA endonuclease N-terminal domain-containing protein n=1 Tax=Clostridium algoriphilum TaxID=198347 RepID=UPI001CF517F2|nr:TnsA endonuclease N-terminal domain-containing protein [Clostridium algoriphilum]MCB2295457.1 DEAD/DEAH box helicase family protein [Clostridium algoriphilum]